MSDTTTKSNLPLATLLLRLSIFLFMLPWVLAKFTKIEQTKGIFAKYYKIAELPDIAAYGVAVVWGLVLLAFVLGFKKRISYGLMMVFHGAGTLMTVPRLIPGLENFNALFLAAIPTLAAMVVLYMLREHDTIGTISK